MYLQFITLKNGTRRAPPAPCVTLRVSTTSSRWPTRAPCTRRRRRSRGATYGARGTPGRRAKRARMRSSRTRDQSRRIEKCVARVAEAFGAEAAFPEALVAFAEAMYHLRRGPMFGRGFGHDDEKTTARLAFLGASHEVACRSLRPVVYAWNGRVPWTRGSSRISEKKKKHSSRRSRRLTWRSHRVRRSSLTTARSALSAGPGATSGSRPGRRAETWTTTHDERSRDRGGHEPRDATRAGLPFGVAFGFGFGSGCPPVGTSQPTRTCSQRPRRSSRQRASSAPRRVVCRLARPRTGTPCTSRTRGFPGPGHVARGEARVRRAPHGGADVLPVDARARRRRASHAVGAGAVAGGESTGLFLALRRGSLLHRFFPSFSCFRAKKKRVRGASSRRGITSRDTSARTRVLASKGHDAHTFHARARDGRARARPPARPFRASTSTPRARPRPKRRSFAGRALAWRAARPAATTTTRSRRSAVESRPVALLAAGALPGVCARGRLRPPASAIEPTQTHDESRPPRPSRRSLRGTSPPRSRPRSTCSRRTRPPWCTSPTSRRGGTCSR